MNPIRPFLALVLVLLLTATVGEARAGTKEWTGQIVCSQCWTEADRTQVPYGTDGDLSCAAECSEKKIPPALAIRRGTGFALLTLDGPPPGESATWLPLIGRFARIHGEVTRGEAGRRLRPTRLALVDASPWHSSTAEKPSRKAAPEWTDLLGRTRTLDDYAGRIVVLNFWATWCAPCVAEMPDLARIQSDYGVYGVQVVGAAAHPLEDRESVLSFARARRVSFPLLLGATTEQMESLELGAGLPATAVIDAEGRIVKRIFGRVERKELTAVLDDLLEAERAGTPLAAEVTRQASAGHDHGHGPDDGHRHALSATEASLVPS